MQRSISFLAVALALGAIGVAVAGAQSRVVTIQARPTNLGPVQNVFLSGGVSSGRNGETLTLQAKPCAASSFRNLFVFRTGPGGRWLREYGPGINTVLRVRWGKTFSNQVTVRQAPVVQLDETSPGEFEAGVGSLGMMWRKRVEIQKREAGRWVKRALGRPDRDVHEPGTERRLDGCRLQALGPEGHAASRSADGRAGPSLLPRERQQPRTDTGIEGRVVVRSTGNRLVSTRRVG